MSKRRRFLVLRARRGQVATFLIILMVIVLIMGLFLTNLGQLSAEAVTVTNAADASTLFLASQLASKANSLCTSISKQHDLDDCSTEEAGIFCRSRRRTCRPTRSRRPCRCRRDRRLEA